MRDGRFEAERLVDLSRLDDLSYVEGRNGTIAIGALTTYTTMKHSPLLQAIAPSLVEVAGLVGGVQTQNRGTVGGNIANASPAGDTLPPLLTLNADVTLASVDGLRTISLAALLQGPGITGISSNEVISEIIFQRPSANTKSTFLRLGNRRGLVISIVSAALVLQLDKQGEVEDARIALGAVGPTPIRCPEAESLLLGRLLTEALIEEAAAAAERASSPIDDVRGSAAYRRHGVRVLVRRGLLKLAGIR
jgi:carbon-monoxide dehydrogenase medium subunit